MSGKGPFKTHTGHKLTAKEEKFIQAYIETGNLREAVKRAGYFDKIEKEEKKAGKSSTKYPEMRYSNHANLLLKNQYIREEINFRMEQMKDKSIADGQEVLRYLSQVMRGEIKDQFGLEAPLSERTKAAQELAKRTIDIENKLNGKDKQSVKIELVWEDNQE